MDDFKKVSLIFLALMAVWIIVAIIRKPPEPKLTATGTAPSFTTASGRPQPVRIEDLPPGYTPNNNSSGLFGNLFNVPIFPTQGTTPTQTSLSQADPYYDQNLSQEELEEELNKAEEEALAIQERIKELEEEERQSPYFGLVTVSRGNAGASSEQTEYVTLQVSTRLDETISISGWNLYSEITGVSVFIPQVDELPILGNSPLLEPLRVEGGETIYVLTGSSPLGSSFRLNSCSGFLTQSNTYTPNIYSQCPDPINEMELKTVSNPNGFTRDCIDFVDRIPLCRSNTTDIPRDFSQACALFILDINYNSCVEDNRYSTSFYKNEWRVYLRRGDEIWNNREEIIVLYDNNGKVVDTLSY